MAFDGSPQTGHNNPPLSRADFLAAIDLWTRTRQVANALAPHELGELPAFERIDAQRKGLILGLARYYEDNPRADAGPGVLALITLYSDNEEGTCTLSQISMGKMLRRSRKAMVESTARLEKSGLVRSFGEPGKGSVFSPVIPRAVACENHMAWLAQALKGETCNDEVTGACNDEVTRKAETCNPKRPEPVTTRLHYFTTLNSDEEGNINRAHESAEVNAFLEEGDFEDFCDGMNAFIASDPRNMIPLKQKRDFTDKILLRMWKAWTTLHSPSVSLAAFRSVNFKASVTTAKYAPTFDGYCKYVENSMQGENGALTKITVAQGKARTAVEVEQELGRIKIATQGAIGSQQIAAHAGAIERNSHKRIETAAADCSPSGRAGLEHAGNTEKFNEAWLAYPDRMGMSRDTALRSWQAQGCEAIASTVIEGVKAYAKSFAEDRRRSPDARVKHMHGWLAERRWESYEVAPEEDESKKVQAISLDLVRDKPEFITRYGWPSLDEVKSKVPQLWNAALDYARREFTDQDTVRTLTKYSYAQAV